MRSRTPQPPSTTLVIVSHGWLARIDFAGRFRSKMTSLNTAVWQVPTEVDRMLTDGIERAIQLSNDPIGKLAIISPMIWTDFLTLPLDVVQIASPAELVQALALEAECETGISAFNSKIVHQQVDSTRKSSATFCVSQIDQDLLEQAVHIAAQHGTRLISLSHPATILARTTSSNWSKQTSSLSDLLQQSLTSWRQFETDPPKTEEFSVLVRDLANAWSSLANRIKPLQILPETRRLKVPSSFVSLSVTAMTIGLCWLLNQKLDKQISDTRSQLQQTEKQQTEASDIESNSKRLDTKLVQLRKELNDAQKAKLAADLKAQNAIRMQALRNQRWSNLLDALAKINSDCWIQRIDSESGLSVLHGLAISQSAAQTFAVELELQLSGSGWQVSPAITTPINAELFSFVVSLSPDDTLPTNLPNQQQIVMAQPTFKTVDETAFRASKELAQ